jgi:tetratricopeptide (TPR) repeat protein
MGEGARSEARSAVSLEPNSALAQKTLAEILKYDRVGRKLRPGSDWAGSHAALRTAESLDPDDKSTVATLAILLEYDSWGSRYSPDARLKEAIAEYRKLTPEKLAELDLTNNLAFALFYDRQFAEAEKIAQTSNQPPLSLIVASEGALNGLQAAVSEARKRSAGEEQFKQIVGTAGDMLENAGIYSVAPNLKEIGASGDNASDVAADAAMLRQAKPHAQIVFTDDPAGTAMRFYAVQSDPNLTLDQLRAAVSRNGAVGLASDDMRDEYLKSSRGTLSEKARNGLFSDVGLDLAIARAQPKVQGNDSTGYRVTLWPSAKYKSDTFVVKEDGKYRVLADSASPGNDTGVGLEVLDRLAQNNTSGARLLLDWLRDDYHLYGGDDPLAGLSFPRLWTKGRNADASAMTAAAAAILVEQKETAMRGIALLKTAGASSVNEIERLNISLAILTGYVTLDDFENELAISRDLVRQYPESARAFYAATYSLRALRRFGEAEQLAQERLQRIPGDTDAMRALAAIAASREAYATARAFGQQLVDQGEAEPGDLNGIAWNSLFTGKVEPSDLESALKGAQLSNKSPSILHTLGCVYAELGKAKEAREVLTEAMDKLDLDEPDDNYWYAFGRIAEQYGERNIALADYAKVTKPKRQIEIPGSSYHLAQIRIAALGTQPPSQTKQK